MDRRSGVRLWLGLRTSVVELRVCDGLEDFFDGEVCTALARSEELSVLATVHEGGSKVELVARVARGIEVGGLELCSIPLHILYLLH